ncbi:alpha/beta hydrolase [Streptomyces sp. NPDC051677]|uniref:alpha/beta hydrolase n=1 Tax=Streptomyces sp. NPDC051677 TaxID=3365669 RepID=UPI0037D856D8
MRRDVEFTTEDGTLLRGYLHTKSEQPAPCIVMAHGFSGVKEQIDHYASFFAHAGFTALVYDHRGFGTSEGTPRLEVDPLRQIADWRDALTFAETLDEVDQEAGIGVWGSSFAGGLAMVLAADDRRVRCVVAQIPNVSGHRNSRQMFSPVQREELDKRLIMDRRARLAGKTPAMIPVFSTTQGELCALPPAVSQKFIESGSDTTPTWCNEVTLRSLGNMVEFEPAGWVQHVAPTPLLMIVGSTDTCTFPEIQLDVFEQARHPKKLVIHPGGHFQTYVQHFEETSQAALDWFVEHLWKI